MNIQLRGEGGEPVRAVVFIDQIHGALCTHYDPIRSTDDGIVELPCDVTDKPLLLVHSYGGYWARTVHSPHDGQTVVLKRINANLHEPWWQKLSGRRRFDGSGGKEIKIGIVDIGFEEPAPEWLRNVSCRRLETKTIDGRVTKQSEAKRANHGLRVSQLIARHEPSRMRFGMAPESDFVFYDVGYVDGPEDEPIKSWDSELLAASIEVLSHEHEVNIINISGGIPHGRMTSDEMQKFGFGARHDDLHRAILSAYNAGTLCVAAVGNNRNCAVAQPAAYKETIGVGAIGVYGQYPPGTLPHDWEREAHGLGHAGMIHGYSVFGYIHSSLGEGLDLVGPGVGLVCEAANGTLTESSGTSFAVPVVVGILACRLENDDEYKRKRGKFKAEHARSVLLSACKDLRLSVELQGAGMPRLL